MLGVEIAVGHRAGHAVMLLQSSGEENEKAHDYREFIALFGCDPNPDGLTYIREAGMLNNGSYATHWLMVELHMGCFNLSRGFLEPRARPTRLTAR